MSAFEHYAPLAAAHDDSVIVSAATLLNECKQFAYNNKSFKTGLVDRIHIKMIETPVWNYAVREATTNLFRTN